jgi:formylglycine-generating enzyme required for sulfatase activity
MSKPTTNIEPEMMIIPPGEFLMGCENGSENERPVHRVCLDRFAIARYAITNRLYKVFLSETSGQAPVGWNDHRFNHPDQPVTSISWFDATAYCTWIAEQTGKAYRLPTEAEWECAARGGMEGKLFTWGDELPEEQPGYAQLWKVGPEPVGQRPPNGFGLYDISENVHEWCSDWFAGGYYQASPRDNPQGPDSGMRRSSRGGSWRHKNKVTRVAARSSIPPQFQYNDYGFRCAMSLKS